MRGKNTKKRCEQPGDQSPKLLGEFIWPLNCAGNKNSGPCVLVWSSLPSVSRRGDCRATTPTTSIRVATGSLATLRETISLSAVSGVKLSVTSHSRSPRLEYKVRLLALTSPLLPRVWVSQHATGCNLQTVHRRPQAAVCVCVLSPCVRWWPGWGTWGRGVQIPEPPYHIFCGVFSFGIDNWVLSGIREALDSWRPWAEKKLSMSIKPSGGP